MVGSLVLLDVIIEGGSLALRCSCDPMVRSYLSVLSLCVTRSNVTVAVKIIGPFDWIGALPDDDSLGSFGLLR